ncbi:MAG: LacI family DNA-binding transcriptional regulator [Acetivibrionales bacterium]
MANIWDVAKLAGVSKTTVSRVINKNGPVKEETRIAVEDAMKKLNYTPSYFAQSIRTRKTKTIAMLVPDYSNVFYNEMYNGVEEVALKHGYMVMVCNTYKSSTMEINYTKELLKRQVDGIIYNTYKKSIKNINYFFSLSETMPVVFMDHVFTQNSKVSYVVTEGFESSKKAVKYLYEKGCRRIAYIRVPPDISVVNHRYEGYKEGILEYGLKFERELVYQCSSDQITLPLMEVGVNGAKYFMSLQNPPDAIMASIDTMAIGAIKYLKSAGYSVPGDVKVIGYDNIDLCTIIEPALTTIAQPIHSLGSEAAKILISKINGEKNIKDQIVFQPEFIIRDSA